MAGERRHPSLTFPDLDEAIAFHQVLGLRRIYRQLHPHRAELLPRLRRGDEAAAALAAAEAGLTEKDASSLVDESWRMPGTLSRQAGEGPRPARPVASRR